ncbi:hypothetical protein ACWDYJ_29330 [Streptomyces sp. NPDC003042]
MATPVHLRTGLTHEALGVIYEVGSSSIGRAISEIRRHLAERGFELRDHGPSGPAQGAGPSTHGESAGTLAALHPVPLRSCCPEYRAPRPPSTVRRGARTLSPPPARPTVGRKRWPPPCPRRTDQDRPALRGGDDVTWKKCGRQTAARPTATPGWRP